MLVISRQRDEVVVIGDPARPLGAITVVDIRGNSVRLGFTFAPDVPVHRAEVACEIVSGRSLEDAIAAARAAGGAA